MRKKCDIHWFGYGDDDEFFLQRWVWDNEKLCHIFLGKKRAFSLVAQRKTH